MTDFTVQVPAGFVPLILTPEQVHSLANDELDPGVVAAARFADAVYSRVGEVPTVNVKGSVARTQGRTVAHVARRLQAYIEGAE